MKIELTLDGGDTQTKIVIWRDAEQDTMSEHGTIGFQIIQDGERSEHRYIDLELPLPKTYTAGISVDGKIITNTLFHVKSLR